MEIKYKLKDEDIVEFNLFQYKESKRLKITLLLQASLPLVILYLILTVVRPVELSTPALILVLVIFTVLWVFLFRIVHLISVKTRMLLIAKNNPNPELNKEKTLSFGENKLIDSSGNSVNYNDIYKIAEDSQRIYIYEDEKGAFIIPKSYITEEQINYIKSLKSHDEKRR